MNEFFKCLLLCILTYPFLVIVILFAISPQLRAHLRNKDDSREYLLLREQKKAQVALQKEFNTGATEDECPICFMEMGPLKTVALCSHAYCAPCIINYI